MKAQSPNEALRKAFDAYETNERERERALRWRETEECARVATARATRARECGESLEAELVALQIAEAIRERKRT